MLNHTLQDVGQRINVGQIENMIDKCFQNVLLFKVTFTSFLKKENVYHFRILHLSRAAIAWVNLSWIHNKEELREHVPYKD